MPCFLSVLNPNKTPLPNPNPYPNPSTSFNSNHNPNADPNRNLNPNSQNTCFLQPIKQIDEFFLQGKGMGRLTKTIRPRD